MTAPILLCGFNDQSSPSLGIVINEVDGTVLYQNGLPPKLSGGACDFTNPYTSYTYLPAANAGSFSLTAAAPKLTIEATVTLTSASSVFLIGKSGRGYYSVPNFEVGIIDSKLMMLGGASGTPAVGAGAMYCQLHSPAIALGQHHLAFVFDGTVAKGYLDGALVISGTCSAMPTDNYPGEFYIGTEPDQPGCPPHGVIVDEIRITRDVVYSGAFTPPAPGSLSSYVYPAIPVQQAPSISVWSNEETPAQAWPGETAIQTEIDGTFAPIRVFVGNGIDMPTRSDYGYIDGTVTRKGSLVVGHRVVCFDSAFNIIDEKTTASNGAFRFDNLPLKSTVSVLAIDNDAYTYTPASCDRLTPKEYPWT